MPIPPPAGISIRDRVRRLRTWATARLPEEERRKHRIRIRAVMALIHHRPDVTAEICLLLYGNCTVTARSWGGAFHCELDPPVEQGSVYRIELDDGRQGSCVVEEICDWSGDRMALIRGLGDLRKADVKSSR